MTDVARVTSSGRTGSEWTMRSLEVIDDPKRRLDRLVPLLHEMMAWDLVQRAEDGTFILCEDVQERLAILSSVKPARSAQVYVGSKCERCERVTLTRMVDGSRICSSCSAVSLIGDAVALEDVPASLKSSRGFFHRHRPAS
jgi:hypothetical protein